MSELDSYDVAIVGAGIVGLAHALAAARDGRRVLVIDRDAQANGASIRNFGFVTVTGQEQGTVWRRARRQTVPCSWPVTVTKPKLRIEAPLACASRSITSTRRPSRAAASAWARPTIPAPTMATS